jgi:hypothetical protein
VEFFHKNEYVRSYSIYKHDTTLKMTFGANFFGRFYSGPPNGGKIGGRGTGGDDHGGRCRPMATMGPHSQLLSIQQSANLLCDRTTLLKLEITIIINVK